MENHRKKKFFRRTYLLCVLYKENEGWKISNHYVKQNMLLYYLFYFVFFFIILFKITKKNKNKIHNTHKKKQKQSFFYLSSFYIF